MFMAFVRLANLDELFNIHIVNAKVLSSLLVRVAKLSGLARRLSAGPTDP